MSVEGPVLLVEDDRDDVLFMKRAFEKAGIKLPLVVAADGQEAVDYLAGAGAFQDRSRHPLPSHVILDLKLPRKSGLEVLAWIRGDSVLKHLPVTVLTSSSQRADLDRAQELHVDAYHVKPVGFSHLLDTVKEIATRWNLT